MKSILKYILLSGARDRLYLGIFITLAASFSLSIFLGSTSLIEQQQATAAYIAGSSRAILAIGFVLFVCLSVNRAFENKEVEFIISKSISREQFILGYLLGFFIAAFLIFLPLNLAIFLVVKPNILGLLIWSISLLFELTILISFALLASLILKNSFSAIMAAFAFYIISRLMGVFVLAINLPQDLSQVKSQFFGTALKFLSAIFPRLDLFTQSSWLAYGVSDFGSLKIILVQSLIYIPLMIFMAFHDFKKRQF
jgi:ABC-type transport system involved in multi-copper enzyme maturation permease subunit